MKLIRISATLVGLSSGVLGLVGLPAGYEAEVASWEFQVMPGGPPVVLNGTVEEVHAELLRLNPNWDSDFPQRVARSQDQDWTLEKRTDFSMANTLCDATWGSAHDGPISEGIERLERIGGVPRLGPGPGKCSRVSCSWDSAIWWCNDDLETKELLGFGSIADGAQRIRDYCNLSRNEYFAGQAFHPTNWNVIICKDRC